MWYWVNGYHFFFKSWNSLWMLLKALCYFVATGICFVNNNHHLYQAIYRTHTYTYMSKLVTKQMPVVVLKKYITTYSASELHLVFNQSKSTFLSPVVLSRSFWRLAMVSAGRTTSIIPCSNPVATHPYAFILDILKWKKNKKIKTVKNHANSFRIILEKAQFIWVLGLRVKNLTLTFKKCTSMTYTHIPNMSLVAWIVLK